MTTKTTCAARIREALALNDMTQAELCRKTGIGKSAMSQYCKGIIIPRQNRTYILAHALGVSEAWLMGFDVRREREPAAGTCSELDKEVSRLLSQLPPDKKETVADYIRFLLSSK